MINVVRLVKKFMGMLNNIFENIDNEIRQRKSIIHFKDVVYYTSYMNGNKCSYMDAKNHLDINDILSVSKTALIKRRHVNSNYFKKVNDVIINNIYKDIKDPRTVSIDGSKINMLSCLEKDNFSTNKYKTYSRALISCLYDTKNNIPINYNISTTFNERKVLYSQLKYLRSGDILLADRGYYCKELIKRLLNLNINFVLRLKKNSEFAKKLIEFNKNDIIYDYKLDDKIIKLRSIRYRIAKEDYFICTTLTNSYKFNMDKIKQMYKSRWNVETEYGYAKKYTTLKYLKSKSLNTIKQDVCAIHFISIFSSYLELLLKDYIKDNTKYKINRRTTTDTLVNHLLKLLFYNKFSKKNIRKLYKLLGIIKNTLVRIRKNRHYKREYKHPVSIWFFLGAKVYNKFKKKHKK